MNMGGAQRVAATLCNAWSERGDVVTLVATYSGRGECFYPLSKHVRLIFLSELVSAYGKSPWGYAQRFLTLRRTIRECRSDVVVSFLANVNIAAILSTRGLGVPVIVCERNDLVAEATLAFPYRWLRRLLYPLAEMVTVQTNDAARRFGQYMPRLKHLAAISNPIPLGISLVRRTDGPVERRRLIAMGRLTRQKQFDLLLESFARLAPRFPDWDLWIVGDGPLRAELVQLATKLRISQRAFLPGRTTRPWDELARSQVFVLSSAYEGFPNVLLEAMALGLPCVTFNCPSGPREISRDGKDALLVPVNDVAALTETLARVMSDKTFGASLGARAMASVRDRYSIQRVLGAWDELFERVSR
jgi:glycosyltransferase involved in cell wall biosynthesis